MKDRSMTRWERNEIAAGVIGAALLHAYRMTEPDEVGAELRRRVQARGTYMDRQTAIAHYRRLGKAALCVMASAGMELA